MNRITHARPGLLVTLALLIALAGCSSPDAKPDPKPAETTGAKTPEADKKAAADKKAEADKKPAPYTLDELGLAGVAAPPTIDAPAVKKLQGQGATTAYQVGDLLVIHKRTPANSVVSAQLYFLGGSTHLTDKTTGLERLTLAVAADGGTTSTPRDAFHAKLDSVGASIGSFVDRDYAGVSMKCVVDYFDDVFGLLTEVALSPALPTKDFELIRQRQLAQIDSIPENPDTQVSYIAAKSFFKGHPYEHSQLGERETVARFTQEHAAAYHKTLLDPARMMLVVVGNIPAEQLLGQVQKGLGRLKAQGKPAPAVPAVKHAPEDIVFAQKKLPTNYIFGLFAAPAPGDKDYPAMVVAMDYLADRLFEEVRTKRKLTYAVSAGISARKANYGYFYVTAADPAATLPVMFEEVKKLRETTLTDQQITETLNVFITDYYTDLETNASQASLLANAQLLTGDWRNAEAFLGQVKAVKAADIQRVVKTYVKAPQFGVVGPDRSKLTKELFTP